MQFGMLSERELKLADSLDGIQDIRVYEKGYPESMILVVFCKVRGQDMYCALISVTRKVREFKSFNTMYGYLRKNCPQFVASQTERDLPVFGFMLLDPSPKPPLGRKKIRVIRKSYEN